MMVGGTISSYGYYLSRQNHARAQDELGARLLSAESRLDGEIKSAELTAELQHRALVPERVGLDADKLAAALANYEKVRSDWQSFHNETIADGPLQRESGDASFRVAQANRLLGDSLRAEAFFSSAIDTFNRLANLNPAEPYFPMMLGKSLDYLGELYRDDGRPEEADANYRRSLAVLTRVQSKFPSYSELWIESARANNNYGILLQDTGDSEQAKTRFVASERTLRRLIEKQTNNADQLRDLARTLINLGRLYRTQKKYADAEKLYREANAEFDRLLIVDPANERYRFLAATNMMNLGYMLGLKSGDFDSGERCLREAHEEFLSLPIEIKEYRFNLAKCSLNLCALHGARYSQTNDAGDLASARTFCRQAADQLSVLQTASPEIAAFDSWLAIAKGNLAAISDAEGDYPPFKQHMVQAIKLQRKAHESYPANEDYRTRLRDHHQFFALQVLRNHLSDDDPSRKAEALEHLLAAIELGYRADFGVLSVFDPLRDSPPFQTALKRIAAEEPKE